MNTSSASHVPNPSSARVRDRRRMQSLEVFLLFGLPVMSIASCAILAFVAYAGAYSEPAGQPTSANHATAAR